MRSEGADRLFQLYRDCGRMHQLLTRCAEEALPGGLTMPQFELLDLIRQSDEPQLPMVLAERLQLTRGSITNLLQQLERKGLIDLAANPRDGRSKLVRLSQSGSDAHRQCLLTLFDLTTQILRQFSTDQMEPVIEFAGELAKWLEVWREPVDK
jgi:DNA-binding MarR family transcriptional regulator